MKYLLFTIVLLVQNCLAQTQEKIFSKEENLEFAKLVIDKKILLGQGKNQVRQDTITRLASNLLEYDDTKEVAWNLQNLVVNSYSEDPEKKWESIYFLVWIASKTANINIKKDAAIKVYAEAEKLEIINKYDKRFFIIELASEIILEDSDEKLKINLLKSNAILLLEQLLNDKFSQKNSNFLLTKAFEKYYQYYIPWMYFENNKLQFNDSLRELEFVRNSLIIKFLNSIVENKKIGDDEKINLLNPILLFAHGAKDFKTTKNYINIVEPLFLKKINPLNLKDKDYLSQQLAIIAIYSKPGDRWFFDASPIEVLSLIEDISKSIDIKDVTNAFTLSMYKMGLYLHTGKYKELDKEYQIGKKLIPKLQLDNDFKRAFNFIFDFFQLKSLFFRGDLKEGIQKYNLVLKETIWLLNDFGGSNKSMKKAAKQFATQIYELVDMSNFLGNYDEAIKLGEFLFTESDSENLNSYKLNAGKINLLKALIIAYKKTGNEEKATKLDNIKWEAELLSGNISDERIWEWFFQSIKLGEYDQASEHIQTIKDASLDITDTTEKETTQSFISSSEEFVNHLSNDNGSKNIENLNIAYCSKVINDLQILIHVFEQRKNISRTLESIDGAFYFSRCAQNNPISSYLAKKYINLLQDLRSNLVNTTQIDVFTESKSDILRKFTNLFYEIGEYDAARETIKILKENQFLNFIRRKNDTDLDLSTIKLNEQEIAYNQKIIKAFDEIKLLEKNYSTLLKSKNIEEAKLLNKVILSKVKDLQSIKLDTVPLSNQINKISQSTKSLPSIIKSNEAFVDFILEKNKISVYFYTKNKNFVFYNYVEREVVRDRILRFNLALSNKSEIMSELLSSLSETFLLNELSELRNLNITTLKIRTDDLIGLIPLEILPFTQGVLGDYFSTQVLGLGRSDIQYFKPKTLTSFGVTKKYKDFQPLPFVKQELEIINSISTPENLLFSRKIFLNDAFTEKNFLTSFNNGNSILHVATHFKTSKNANGSGFLLMGNGNLFEIANFKDKLIKNKDVLMMVLSACDTGLISKVDNNNNLEGLSNIFNLKGANYVLGTLWPISDEATSYFMGIFYTFILKGNLRPEEALRLTQKAFRSGSFNFLPNDLHSRLISDLNKISSNIFIKYNHPYYWSGFQLMGS